MLWTDSVFISFLLKHHSQKKSNWSIRHTLAEQHCSGQIWTKNNNIELPFRSWDLKSFSFLGPASEWYWENVSFDAHYSGRFWITWFGNIFYNTPPQRIVIHMIGKSLCFTTRGFPFNMSLAVCINFKKSLYLYKFKELLFQEFQHDGSIWRTAKQKFVDLDLYHDNYEPKCQCPLSRLLEGSHMFGFFPYLGLPKGFVYNILKTRGCPRPCCVPPALDLGFPQPQGHSSLSFSFAIWDLKPVLELRYFKFTS